MITLDWTQFYYLVFYFIIYSVGGWFVESIYKSICEKRIVNSGFMYGPYCPIYGFGTLIMILILQNLKGSITLLFVVSFVILTLWEYFVGIYLEKVYHAKYWDYSDHKINFKGRICLTNSVYWGILGVVFTLFIHPLVSHNSLTIPVNVVFYIDLIVGSIMIIDFIVSSIKTHTISKKIQKIKVLSEKIKEKLSKPKTSKQNNKKNDLPEAELAVNELQIQHNRLKIALYRQLTRMKKAFPTMQSDTTNSFLSEKIDIKELKDKIKSIKERTKSIKLHTKNKSKEIKDSTKEDVKVDASESNRDKK